MSKKYKYNFMEDEDDFQPRKPKKNAGDDLWVKKVKPKHKVKKFKYKDL